MTKEQRQADEEFLIAFGNRVANRRQELGMTQEELAKKMGYKTKSSINKIEKGKSEIPQSKILWFSTVLDMPINELMGWETPVVEDYRADDGLDDEILLAVRRLAPSYQRLALAYCEELFALQKKSMEEIKKLATANEL